ncbi:MAG: translesion DNA synthesis-associated protein ImuA [Steroidobacterales bacterium]|jgi:cell division inhibitor SulA/protein ImuA
MFRDLSRLLEHPAIWRGRSAARTRTLPTGFPALDEGLPGGGWPRAGLIEILPACFGTGELALLLPTLAAVTGRPEARWCAWVAPPLQPFAPALAAGGVALERLLVVQAQRSERRSGAPKSGRGEGSSALWAFEQTLRSGACDIALAWLSSALPRQIRRLHLAAEQGATLGVLFRPRQAARDASPAALRVAVEPAAAGMRVTLLKSRGGARGAIELSLR